MTSSIATRRKPRLSSDLGCVFNDPADLAFEAELRLLNQIVDEQGWTKARKIALARLAGVAWWLSETQGPRFVSDYLDLCATQMVEIGPAPKLGAAA